jgi:clan AA aspartic protease
VSIDTGFNGGLVLPRAEAVRLNLTVLGRVPIGGGRSRQIADITELEIEWMSKSRTIEVIISDGDDSLLGTELLDGSRLIIDYVAHTATVTDEVN